MYDDNNLFHNIFVVNPVKEPNTTSSKNIEITNVKLTKSYNSFTITLETFINTYINNEECQNIQNEIYETSKIHSRVNES